MIKIIVDSACDISNIRRVPDKDKQLVQFEKVALTIRVGEKEYVDDSQLDVADMMQAMKEYKEGTSSSCPSPGDYMKCFEGADEIYVVTITSALSGSYNCAQVAREMELENHPEKKICVFDSRSAGPEMELIVEEILREIVKGNSFDVICKNVMEYQKKTKLAFVLHSVDNLVKNGRVSKLAGFAANVLGIAVVGRASQAGELEMITKGRVSKKANSSVIAEMKSQGYKGGPVSITHCFNEGDALDLKERILREYPGAYVLVMETRGLCSYYAEMGGMLIGYETEQREFSLAGVLSAIEKEKVLNEA